MQLTVLGKSPSWEDSGGACSGYLVEQEDSRLLIDCGNGVFSKLRTFCDYLTVDAVVISHMHADHFLDLIPFAYGLTYSPRRDSRSERPRLYAPTGAAATLRRVTGAWGSEELVEQAFELIEYETSDQPTVGALSLRFCEVPHFVRTHAIDVTGTAEGTGRITYGADHGPNDAIVEFAAHTDVLILEATITQPEPEGPRGHITPGEAGDHGVRAGARRLVLTHYSDELDSAAARREAESTFGRRVEMAREGTVLFA